MPADLAPKRKIPGLARQIDSPAMLRVLGRLDQAGFVQNSEELDQETKDILQRLAGLGLADPGYEEGGNGKLGKLFVWVANGNGKRVLEHFDQLRKSKLQIGPLAQTALRVLDPETSWGVLAAIEWLLPRDPGSWSANQAERFRPDEPLYMLRVPPDWLAFIRVLASGRIELFDIMREGTLRMFQEGYSAGSAVQ
jgi:hypothetical protein